MERMGIKLLVEVQKGVLDLPQVLWFCHSLIEISLGLIVLKSFVLFRQKDDWRDVALVDNSCHEFLIISIRLQGANQMIRVDEAKEYLQEFNNYSIGQDLNNLSIQECSRDKIVREL